MNQNDQNLDWKKLLGFRNMQEKLKKIIDNRLGWAFKLEL